MRASLVFTSIALAAAEPLIVGLGSSYAAGPGLASPMGEILQQKLSDYNGQDYNFSNFAVSGSVLGDIPKSQAPKMKGTSPDIVYIVSGGNDLSYVTCLANPTASACTNLISKDQYKQRYEAALDSVVNNAGTESLVIFVVTYIQALGPDTNCGASNSDCPLNATEVSQDSGIYTRCVNGTVDALSAWKKTGSNDQYDVRLIPMRQHSAGHDVGSASPWINGKQVPSGVGGIAWHPNNAGAEAVAEYIFNSYTGC